MSEYDKLILEKNLELEAIRRLEADGSWWAIVAVQLARMRLANVVERINQFLEQRGQVLTPDAVTIVQIKKLEADSTLGVPNILWLGIAIGGGVIYLATRGSK